MGCVVRANRHNLDVAPVEIVLMLRELVQLAHAGWSPISTEEHQQHFAASITGKRDPSGARVFQAEVWHAVSDS